MVVAVCYVYRTATVLERLKVLIQTGLEDKKWGNHGYPGRPYGASHVIEYNIIDDVFVFHGWWQRMSVYSYHECPFSMKLLI